LQTFKTMIRIAMPPKADNPWLDPNLLGDRSVLRPAAASSTIRARFKSRCNVTGERQRSSSTLRSFLERWTSLASGIIPMLNHDSLPRESGYEEPVAEIATRVVGAASVIGAYQAMT
jgi:hypothetical protein